MDKSAVEHLAKQIARLTKLAPIERARLARDLVDVAKTTLAAAGDAAVAEAVAGSSYAEVAAALGVSTSAVNKAVSRHRARPAVGSVD
jgi:DNA-directed RNA polymerase specialized sigma24 family protein